MARDSEDRAAIKKAIEDEEVRLRVGAVLEDENVDDAASRLDAVGPLFRTG